MKLSKISFLLIFLYITFNSIYAQIPVTDVANIAQQVKQVLSWKQQLEAMADQYNQQIDQFNSMTGNRGYGNLFNNPELQQYLSPEWQQIYSSIYSQGVDGLSEGAKTLMYEYDLGSVCEQYREGTQEKINCEYQAGKNAQDADIFQYALGSASHKSEIILNLQNEINNTTDPKSIAELQARIQSEVANLQNEMNKMQLAIKLAEVQNKLVEQKQIEDYLRSVDKPVGKIFQ